MQGVLKNSIRTTTRIFREAPFLGWFIIYIIFISLKWPYIKPWLNQHSLIMQLLLLSIIPFILWYYETRKNRKAYKLRISTFRETKILPKHDIDRLKNLLPDNQIDLFETVLLPSLSMFYATFSEISQEAYYQQKLESLCSLIKKLKKNSKLYTNNPQHKYRDITLTAFSFYRTLFNGAIEFFHKNASRNTQIDETDTWVLLKRVPAKLNLILGAEYWRLYEFWQAVYGDPNSLQLNSDIIAYLTHDTAGKTAVSKDTDEQLTSRFITWLSGKINGDDKRYSLNDGDYIFISPLLYDTSIFITESLLNKYYKITGIFPDNLKQALINQEILGNKQYLIEQGAQRIFLMKLNNISVQKTAAKTVSIVEAAESINSTQTR
jgi:hypothetical protein